MLRDQSSDLAIRSADSNRAQCRTVASIAILAARAPAQDRSIVTHLVSELPRCSSLVPR
jgi:hypothetical protein